MISKVAPESIKIYREIEAVYGKDRLFKLIDEIDALINSLEEPSYSIARLDPLTVPES
ncbi:hypothetical protein MES5069_760031 [Mesorhizobium escarrei]|uniref:Uncharacterized protein n=1 Tax=Mesorhizobium escarrei TaxID=666018 RepID=A0ABN8KK28_9HYPH|nr:hypothetical protein MES5069_760031 [Mesorhizobium escarrei]